MPAEPSRRIKPWRGRVFLLLLVGLAGLFWFGHPPVFSRALRQGLVMLCAAHGLDFEAGRLSARLDAPFVIEGMKLRAAKGSGLTTSLDVARIEWEWNGIMGFFAKDGRCVLSASVRDVSGVWDARTSAKGPAASPGALAAGRPDPAALLRWIPLALDIGKSSVEILGDDQRWAVRNLDASFSEYAVGRLDLGGALVQSGTFTKSFPSLHAVTAWKGGTLWLSAMELVPGIVVENFSLDALDADGPSASLLAAVFGGTLRADASLAMPGRTWDVAAWAANITLDRLPPLLDLAGKAAGRLVEGHFTFRGRPERPADAEASLRLVADGFHWNEHGWESLEIGASLIHRRLVVTNFDLRQKENWVNFNGEVSLAEGWSQIATSPFLLNVRADIKEVGELAGILGAPLDEVAGRMTAAGSLSGRPDKVDGFLSVEASALEFRSLPVNSLHLEAVFRQSEVEIARCEAYSRKDTLQAKGAIGLAAPHHYSAELDARVADLAAYLVPFRAPGAGAVYAGSLAVRWQGDGSAKAHSGAFDMELGNFVSRLTPAGLTGKFAGTYSPQNLYFSRMEMDNGRLHLGSRATVAASGVTVKDLELRAGDATLLEGAGFFPINVFAIASGTDWRAAIDAGREAYVRAVTPKELNIPDLMRLAGQEFPLQGQLRLQLEAGGPPAQLHADGLVTARGLAMPAAAGVALPESTLDAKLIALDGVAVIDGLVRTKGLSPLTLKARSPFGLIRTEAGTWRWINPKGEFEASLDFPRTDISVFSPFLPKMAGMKGEISGRLELAQTFANPKFSGRIDLKNGGIEGSVLLPPVEKTEAVVVFEGTEARIERFRGEVGPGTFEITGGAQFSTPSNPSCDLRLRGDKILLVRDGGLRLRANVDLHAVGDRNAGLVDGIVRLIDGRVGKRFVVTPVLVLLPEDEPGTIEPPVSPGSIPEPFARWALDVKVENGTPFLLEGNLGRGEIVPAVRLAGTLARPVPVGRISLKEVQAFLPFTTFTIRDGRIDFFPDAPWVPMLDIRGTAKTPDGEVRAFAFGPFNERKLILRSDPPLSQESLVLLLATGTAPGTAPTPYRLQPDAPNATGLRPALREKIRLWDNLGPANERDGFQIHNVGASYQWRFE